MSPKPSDGASEAFGRFWGVATLVAEELVACLSAIRLTAKMEAGEDSKTVHLRHLIASLTGKTENI